MKTLYLDCSMGAAGDMLTAALLELLPDPDGFISKLNALGIPKVRYAKESSVSCGIRGTHVTVTADGAVEDGANVLKHAHEHVHEHAHEHEHEHAHEHEHEHEHDHESIKSHVNGHDNIKSHVNGHDNGHSGMHDIEHIVSGLDIPEKVRRDVLAVYGLIADAESRVHGVPVSQIHFHEVGTLDAVADVTAVCMLMNELAPDRTIASPVHVGSGHVHCAHGILPVPAPATALILMDVPIYGGSVKGELCTPTGAALLKYFVSEYGDMPAMSLKAIGYGMGTKDFGQVNCVRALLGETDGGGAETIYKLECNVDDMTAEDIAYAVGTLAENGAKDVYTVPVGMKKNRAGTLVSVLCGGEDREKLVRLMFTHLSTIGIRETAMNRYVLSREIRTARAEFGGEPYDVSYKVSEGYGVSRVKYEYEDIARIAKERGVSLEQVRKELNRREDS